MLVKYKNEMRKLWLPSTEIIRNSCSRQIMGFVTKGGFRYSNGRNFAIGYVAISSLPYLFAINTKNKVLIRNTSSRQYRLALMDIIL